MGMKCVDDEEVQFFVIGCKKVFILGCVGKDVGGVVFVVVEGVCILVLIFVFIMGDEIYCVFECVVKFENFGWVGVVSLEFGNYVWFILFIIGFVIFVDVQFIDWEGVFVGIVDFYLIFVDRDFVLYGFGIDGCDCCEGCCSVVIGILYC